MPPWQAHVEATPRQRHRYRHVSTPTFREALLAFRQINTSHVPTKMNLAGEFAFVLSHVKGSSPLWLKERNPRAPEAQVRFPLPKLPRKVPNSGKESVTVVSATQSPELFGYHPPNRPSRGALYS